MLRASQGRPRDAESAYYELGRLGQHLNRSLGAVSGLRREGLELKMAFVLPRRLGANPQLYDYVHGLHFSEDGAVEMVDLAGQAIISIARGRFHVETISESDAILYLSDLVEVDPHKQNEKICDLESCQIQVSAEAGVFVFQRPISPSHAEAQWPFHVYRNRYVFDVDPLAYARDKEIQNLFYHLVMTPALIESARYYYPLGSENKASAADVRALGIAPPLSR